ncbi:MAG: hypothetical protein Q9184_007031 [Pyrenodesmia sp. 2 TL-2023]
MSLQPKSEEPRTIVLAMNIFLDVGRFCPEGSEEQPGSKEDFQGRYLKVRGEVDLRKIDLDVCRKRSKRLHHNVAHVLWSPDSQEELHELPLPIYFKKDRIVQEVLAIGEAQQLATPPTDIEVAAPPVRTENGELPPDTVRPKLEPRGGEARMKEPGSEKKNKSKGTEKSGKGDIPGRKDRDVKTSSVQSCGERAPAIKNLGSRKKNTKAATPQWLLSLLEQPTQTRSTRSKESRIFIQLDKHCQVIPALPASAKTLVLVSRIS